MSDKPRDTNKFDFAPISKALKSSRERQKLARGTVAEKVGISNKYLADIENKGKHPGFQVFMKLMDLFNLSVDEFRTSFASNNEIRTSARRQLDAKLDSFSEDKILTLLTVLDVLETVEKTCKDDIE